MGTSLENVLKKLAELKSEADYWTECIGLGKLPEIAAQISKLEEFLKELSQGDGDET